MAEPVDANGSKLFGQKPVRVRFLNPPRKKGKTMAELSVSKNDIHGVLTVEVDMWRAFYNVVAEMDYDDLKRALNIVSQAVSTNSTHMGTFDSLLDAIQDKHFVEHSGHMAQCHDEIYRLAEALT